MAQVFSILTLPRCRSAWLANYLDYPPCLAIHEPSRFHPADWADLRSRLVGLPFAWACIVDPSASIIDPEGWAEAFGDLPVGYVRRPPSQVVRALWELGAEPGVEERVEQAVAGMDMLQGAYPGPELSAEGVTEPVALAAFLGKLAPGLPFGEFRHSTLRGMRVTVIPEVRYGLKLVARKQ